jgi:hypothetical protein
MNNAMDFAVHALLEMMGDASAMSLEEPLVRRDKTVQEVSADTVRNLIARGPVQDPTKSKKRKACPELAQPAKRPKKKVFSLEELEILSAVRAELGGRPSPKELERAMHLALGPNPAFPMRSADDYRRALARLDMRRLPMSEFLSNLEARDQLLAAVKVHGNMWKSMSDDSNFPLIMGVDPRQLSNFHRKIRPFVEEPEKPVSDPDATESDGEEVPEPPCSDEA